MKYLHIFSFMIYSIATTKQQKLKYDYYYSVDIYYSFGSVFKRTFVKAMLQYSIERGRFKEGFSPDGNNEHKTRRD